MITEEGFKPISEVRVGDRVLTHKGRYRPVLAVGSKVAPTIKVKGQGAEIVTTHEHPFLSRSCDRRWNNERRSYDRTFGDEAWTDAKDLKGRFWASLTTYPELPIPPVLVEGRETDPEIVFSPEFLWFVGTWLGNGWTRITSRRGYVLLADAHASAAEVSERIAAAGLRASKSVMKTATRFQIASRPLARWLEAHFGKYAHRKTIPPWVLGLPDALRRAFLDGYLFADGNPMKTSAGWRATTTSVDIALGVKCLFWSFGRSVTFHKSKPRKTRCIIQGREVSERLSYQINSPDVSRSSLEIDGKRWGLVREVVETGMTETVYNIEVADDHTYTADGVVVHNCQDFSVAGLRAGIDGARGSLTLDFLRLAQSLRPRWILWENVPGVLSSDDGRALGAFLGGLEELGYGWAYRILDAQYVRVDGYPGAVPQRRRRIFVVGCAGGDWLRAGSVLFEPEGVRGYPAPRREARKEAARSPGIGSSGISGAGSERPPPEGQGVGCGDGRGDRVADVWWNGSDVAETLTCTSDDQRMPDKGRMQMVVQSAVPRGAVGINGDVAGTLDANYGKGPGSANYGERDVVVSMRESGQGYWVEDVVAGTLDAHMHFEPQRAATIAHIANYGERGGMQSIGVCVNVGINGDVAGTLDAYSVHGEYPTAMKSKDIVRSAFYSFGGVVRETGEVMSTLDAARESRGTNQQRFLLDAAPASANYGERGGMQSIGVCVTGDRTHALKTEGADGSEVGVRSQMAVRRLTPVECERLQGFPDGWTQIPWKKKPASECPDGPRYKALGNSMACNVMRWIGRRIERVDEVFAELEAGSKETP